METLLKSPISIKELQNKFATSGVYAIYCNATDTYYIGQATVVLRRLSDHFTQLAKNEHPNNLLQQEYNQFGEDTFVVDLLVELPDALPVMLQQEESKEIQRFKLNFKSLYNKTSLLIKTSRNGTPTKKLSSNSIKHTGDVTLSHAEREQSEPQLGICYDCGFGGTCSIDIYECDDHKIRCQKCVEKHLQKWTLFGKNIPIAKPTASTRFMRWQYFKTGHFQEQLLSGLQRYHEKHCCFPSKMFVNEIDKNINLNEIEGIEVYKRRITPLGCIDFQLDAPDLRLEPGYNEG